MDVFTVCNVLQAIGVLEDAAINPPGTSKEPATPAPPEPNDPTSPQPSLPSAKLLQHDTSRPLSTIPLSSLSTPTTNTSLPSELPERLSSGPPDMSQILRSSTPIIPISFEGGESSTPVNTAIPPISNLSHPPDSSVKNKTELKVESSSEVPLTLLSSTGAAQITPSSSIQPPQSRSTYGSQVESALTARWEKQLRDYLKDLRCRKISHIMGRESYHGGSGSVINSRVGSSNRSSMNPGPVVSRLSSSVPMSLPVPLVNQSPHPVTQSSSLDEEEFEEDDETAINSQSTTPPSPPLGIAVPPTGLSIILPQTTSQSKAATTPRDSSIFSVPKLSSPTAASIQTGMMSPTSTAPTVNTVPAKEKKIVMRRFTGSTRGGWTFPTPVNSPNDFGFSQYDIFLNPQEVLAKWSQICYEENKAEEIEECLLRQIAAKCGLSLPVEPFRIGTQYLSPDYRVTLTKTRSGSISQIPGEILSSGRSRSRSSSVSASRDGQKSAPKQPIHPEASTTANTSSLLTQNHGPDLSFSSPSLGDIKKSVPIVGGVYDETSSWTAATLIEKAKRNQLINRNKIFQRKPRFDDPTSNYFFSESHSSLLTSPRHSTPLNTHGCQTPIDPPSSRKRSRSGSTLLANSTTGSNRPYCPILLLYDSLYRENDSTNTDQSAGPDVCPVTGRLSLVDIIINTRPIPWIDIAKQFNILQIDDDIDFVSQPNEDLASSKTQLFPIGHNLNGSIGTWVDIRVDSDGEKDHDLVKIDDTKAKERRGRKKFSSISEDAMDERRPKRLQRNSSVSSLNEYDERKNYRQEFRRVSFADVLAPSFREVANYDMIYLNKDPDEKETLEDTSEVEDLSDEAFAKRHEDTLKRMRDKWAQIQEIKDSLKRPGTTSSTPPSDKIHHASPRHSNSHKSSKSPSGSHEKIGRKNGSLSVPPTKSQKTSTISADSEVEVPLKRRRGRQSFQRSVSESTGIGSRRNRRNQESSLVETPSGIDQLHSLKKRNIREVTSELKSSELKSSDPSRPRKRGRPPKYHPPPAPLSSSQQTATSDKVCKSEKSLKKVESGLSTRLSSPSSSSRHSPADFRNSLGQFPSADIDTLGNDSLQRSGSKRHRSLPVEPLDSPPKPLILVEKDSTLVEFPSHEEQEEENENEENQDEDEGDENQEDMLSEDDHNESEDF